jgi:hypothetical protein
MDDHLSKPRKMYRVRERIRSDVDMQAACIAIV